ncbi:tetratricopeptide repeat protein [Pseudogracilibacillus auburnensis]|uniref:tetratricopeptide repeat protein n=1 Tax=Pseudogracilibacillus auburnensis TaxID=1494959 RepID=UPI001A970ECE|nr:tetratricopeptide repeat protein [Pseudogracilibacillus auburnensis]MBO1003044.1 tetratricopeptide repeat protein [Pseudogracilibacillus auburnensis]
MDKIEQATEWMNDGKVDEAIELLQQMIPTASDDEKFMIAENFYDWGFFEEAIVLLEQLVKKYPKEGQLLTKLAEMYIELEKDEIAIHLLNDMEEEDPFYIQSLIHLADLYQAQGLFEVSEQKLLEAKKLDPDEVIIDFALGELLFSIGQSNRAIPFYEKVLRQTTEVNHISITERLAECHATIGHYEEALQFYNKIENEHPDTLFKYGFTAYQQNRNDIAINVWKRLIELDPYYHSVYVELAMAMKAEGLMEDAYETAKQGLVYDQFNKELFYLVGQLALQLHDEAESIEHLNKAIDLDYDYKEAIVALVQLYEDKEQYSQIIELLTGIKESGVEDPIYDWELAKALAKEERYKEALTAYNNASEHLTYDSEFLKEYGYFLTEEGLIKDAIQVLTKYLKLDPFDEETLSFVERLNLSINE